MSLFLLLVGIAHASYDPLTSVSPFIGTGGLGFGDGSTPPGAQFPYGFARVSPDTAESFDIVIPFQHFGGYFFDDVVVRAFTHVHMQGAGSPDLGVIGVMPFTSGKVTASSIDVKNEGYRQSFSKSSEQASPGFYSMQMDNGVTVELTATPLCGHHRYTYDKSVANRVVLFLPSITILGDGRHLNVTMAFDPTALAFSGSIQVDESMSGRKPGGLPIYFSGTVAPVAPTTAKLESFGTWVDSSISVGSTFASAGSGHSVGGFLQFSAPTNTSSNLVLELKLGLSLIDVTTAKRNLQQEIGSSQSFDVTVAAARNAWRMVLQRTTPVSPTMSSLWQKRERMFYTAFYHANAAPTNYTEWDANARPIYLGMDDDVHSLAVGASYMSDLSIWDIHRTQTPLMALVSPNVSSAIVESLLLMYQQGGAIPRWPLANVYTGAMVGSHGNVIIADAYFRGVPISNVSLAMEAMWRALRDASLPHVARAKPLLDAWLALGFMPDNLGESRSAAVALDWAYDDGVTARFANSLGYSTLAKNLSATASNFRNHWHNSLFCPRHNDASGNAVFNCPSELDSYNPFDSRYVEDDAQVYSYFVLHDVPSLVQLNGGNATFVKRLQAFCECSFYDEWTALPDPCVWVGNEPSLAVPWLFNFAGRADLTQIYTHRLAMAFFSDAPDGIPGNDDYGTTSSWLFFAMIGLYPLAGTDLYILGAPMFQQIELLLGASKTLTILTVNFKTDGSSNTASKASLNGVAIDMRANAFVTHAALTALPNNVLQFVMD